ncbi:GpE family phage tail protein [Asticcacaulis biprosthecium]
MISDIAFIYHWPPERLWEMEAEDLVDEHARAMDRYRAANGIKDK